MPNGRRLCAETDGNTTNTRSRKMATSPISAMTTSGAWRCGGRRQALDEVRERNDQPWRRSPRPASATAAGRNGPRRARLHRHVAVPDDQGTATREVHPHDRHRELQLRHVLHGEGGMAARPRAFARTVRIREQTEGRVERTHHEVAAEEAAVPVRSKRHHEVEAPSDTVMYSQSTAARSPAVRCTRTRSSRAGPCRAGSPPRREAHGEGEWPPAGACARRRTWC